MKGNRAVLGDFGSCCLAGVPSRGSGTIYYRSPEGTKVSATRNAEISSRSQPQPSTPAAGAASPAKKHLTSFKSDLWSLGITLVEVILGRQVTKGLLFDDSCKDAKSWIDKVSSTTFWENASPRDIIKTFTLRKDIKARLQYRIEEMRECGLESIVPLVMKLLAVDPKARPTALAFHHMLSKIHSPSVVSDCSDESLLLELDK